MLNKDNNPWLGLSSYEYEDSYRFFGREKELANLKDAVCNNLITTIYGISGAGKTSLVNAGMCPLLNNDTFLPVRIRLEHLSEIKYSEQIINAVHEALTKINGEIETTAEVKTEQALEDGQKVELIPEEEKLWLFFHTSSFWSASNHHICPVIFIDQFEEIFTKNKDADSIRSFFNCINSLQYDVPPSATAKLLEERDEYVELTFTDNFRIVFIMREDFLARLEDYAYDIPALRKNRVGIKRMNGLQALDVILRPMPGIIRKDVALEIISKVSGRPAKDNSSYLEQLSVDTSILSLFCSELFLKAADQMKDKISSELIEQSGENILFSFYDNTMSLVSPRTIEYLETHLLTRSGFRNSVALEDLLDNGIKKEELDKLNAKRLVRIETANGTERVEYTHDVLCTIAKEHRDKRLEKNNRKSSVFRNFGFIFDSTITTLCIFALLFWLYCHSSRPNFSHFPGAILFLSTFYLLVYSFTILPYRFTKEGNTKWIMLIASFLNAIASYFIITHWNLDETIGLSLLFIFFFYPIIQFLNSLRFDRKHSFKSSVKYIFNLKIYSEYPFFKTVIKYFAFAAVVYVSFLIGLSLNVTYSYIAIPVCGLLSFILISDYTKVYVKYDWKSMAIYAILLMLLLINVKAQFYHNRMSIMIPVWLILLFFTFFYVKKNSNESTLKRQLSVSFFMWFVSLFIIPIMNMGYNVFRNTDVVRIHNGVINDYNIARFLIVENKDHQRGVRDRWNLVVPTEFDSIVRRVFINVDDTSLPGLLSFDRIYKIYLDTDDEDSFSPMERLLFNVEEFCNTNSDILFITIKEDVKKYWLCSEHLNMDNSCTEMIASDIKTALGINGKIKYLRYLYGKNEAVFNSEINQRLRECFTYELRLREWSELASKYMAAEIGSAEEDSLLNRIRYIREREFDESYLNNLKRGRDSISYSLLRGMISSNLELLAMNRDKKVSQLLLDTIYPKSKNVLDSNSYYVNLSYYKLFARDFEGAELASKRAIANDTSSIIAYTNLFDALYLQNKYDLAFDILEKYKNYNTQDSSLYYKYFGDGIWEDFSDLIKYGVYNETDSEQFKQLKAILKDYVDKPLYTYGESWMGRELRAKLDKKGNAEYFYVSCDNEALTPTFSDYLWHVDGKDSILWFRSKDKEKCGYYLYSDDKAQLIPAKFEHSWIFSEDIAVVEIDKKLGFIDKKGNYVLEPSFAYSYDEALEADRVDFVFHDGCCPMVAAPGKHGLVDRKGEWVVQPEYSYINNPVNDYRIVRQGGKYGLMDSNLHLVLPVQYGWINQNQENNTITINENTYTYSQLMRFVEFEKDK